MKILAVGVLSTTLAAGLVGSVAAYRSQLGHQPEAERPVATDTETPRPDRSLAPRVRWAPCPPDSRLERGSCVIDVVRTVVLPAPTSSPTRVVAPSPARPEGAGDDSRGRGAEPDEGGHEGSEGEDQEDVDEDEDDGHEDDGHEDDGHEDEDGEDEDGEDEDGD